MYRFFWLLLTLCSFTYSCTKKEPGPTITILKGKIVDSVTREPVSNASILFAAKFPSNRYPGTEISYNEWAVTNEQGMFEHTFGSEIISASLFEIIADGYLYKHVNFGVSTIYAGEERECEVPLVQSDAVLRIYVKNETGQQPNVHLKIKNPSIEAEAGYPWLQRADLNKGQEQIIFVRAIGDEHTTVSWSLGKIISNQLPPMHEDDILMVKNDTVHYSIIY